MTARKTFRFNDETLDQLAMLSESWGVDQSEAVRRCIHKAACASDTLSDSSPESSDTRQTPYDALENELVDALKAHIVTLEAELEAKQIELRLALETNLKQAENLSEAHTLNAADKIEALPETSKAEPMTRLDHLKAIFRRKAAKNGKLKG